MKIALKVNGNGPESSRAAQARVLERDILGAKRGDWAAKTNLVKAFMPLLQSLAAKRAADTAQINAGIEAGKEGLYQAARKYSADVGAESFQIFAVDFIEKSMDRGGSKPGFLARLFGR